MILGIRPSIERERTPIPTGEGLRDRRRPEKLVPLCKTSMSVGQLWLSKLFHQTTDYYTETLSIMLNCQGNLRCVFTVLCIQTYLQSFSGSMFDVLSQR